MEVKRLVVAYFPYKVTSGEKRKSETRFKKKSSALACAKKWRKEGRKNVIVRKLR